MSNRKDLTGQRFGALVAIEPTEERKGTSVVWRCLCDCGNEKLIPASSLTGGVKSCGCKKSPDKTGIVFGKLTVIGRSDKRGSRGTRTTPLWECRCECGNITYKATDTLTNSAQSMCLECAIKYATENARKKAGYVGGTQLPKIKDLSPTAANTTGYRGVYYVSKSDRWRAEIYFQKKRYYLGTYRKKEEAIKARKKAEEKLYGTFLEQLEATALDHA